MFSGSSKGRYHRWGTCLLTFEKERVDLKTSQAEEFALGISRAWPMALCCGNVDANHGVQLCIDKERSQ